MYRQHIFVFVVFLIPCMITRPVFSGYVPEDKYEVEFATPSVGMPWPMPQQMVSKSEFLLLHPSSFQFILNRPECEILQKAVTRITKLTFLDHCNMKPQSAMPSFQDNKISYATFRESMDFISHLSFSGVLTNISITVQQECEKYPYMNMDEMYTLRINSDDKPNQAMLFSNTVWGALRGLETFSQLVYQVGQPGAQLFAVNSTTILDFPRFSHRGLLLDTSRHFVPMHVLYDNVEAMAQNKMNVFHWHIVDDQSFPYTSIKFPEITRKGAFNPATHVYSTQDIASLIEYARVRGIRVLVEFDTPGHTQSWGKGQPDLLTPCYSGNQTTGMFGPINPIYNKTYMFLKEFFREVAEVFPDGYIHLGGDEVSFACWQSNPDVNDFMRKMGFPGNYSKLEAYYISKLLKIVKSLNRNYIIWQEVVDNNVQVNPDTVVHVWKDGYKDELSKVTKMGLKTLLSSCWYLNYIAYGDDWKTAYACDPQEFNGTAKQKQLVIGGEACMWGEYVDGTNLMTRTWPRTSAVAERLWSSKSTTNAASAVPRLEEQRCRMLKRGLRVEPVNGPSYCPCDYLV